MRLSEFEWLSKAEQSNAVYEEGVYIGKTNRSGRPAVLYQLDSFYVEIVYKKYRRQVLTVEGFTAMDRLDSYLQKIPIEHLVAP